LHKDEQVKEDAGWMDLAIGAPGISLSLELISSLSNNVAEFSLSDVTRSEN
jgi:hypothetical protein